MKGGATQLTGATQTEEMFKEDNINWSYTDQLK